MVYRELVDILRITVFGEQVIDDTNNNGKITDDLREVEYENSKTELTN